MRLMKPIRYLLLLLFFVSTALHAQYYLSGQDPASVKWKQFRHGQFRLIFPENNQAEAFRIAKLLEFSYPHLAADLKTNVKPTNLILHTSSVISNATAAWAPRRLDFYHISPQDGYSQEWYKQLSLHELRHTLQFSKMNQGFGKFVGLLTGQQGAAAIAGLFLPLWFIEGDAVVTETAFSSSGRGRQSVFEAGLKAQLVEKGIYSYDKAYFGSYRDKVPDVYELGYFLVGYNRNKFGNDIWLRALDMTARQTWRLNPFSAGLKKLSGLNKKGLYHNTLQELKNKWISSDSLIPFDTASPLLPPSALFTSYRAIRSLPDGSVIAIRQKIDDVPAIVRVSDNTERLLVRPGTLLHPWLSVTDSLIAWAEYQQDIRWSNRSFSVIKLFDFTTGKINQLTYQSRYFAPDIQPGGTVIAAVSMDSQDGSSIVFIDLKSGAEVFSYRSDSLAFSTPRWSPDGTTLYFAALGSKGKCLMKLAMGTTEAVAVSNFTFTDFMLSATTQDGILLQGDWEGNSSIFVYRPEEQKLTKIYSGRFATVDACLTSNGKALLLADYSADGFVIRRKDIAEIQAFPSDFNRKPSFAIACKLSDSVNFNLDDHEAGNGVFPVKNYRKAGHLFNFHSWSPLYIEADNQQFAPGLSLLSQNALSTMVADVGYRYDMNEQTGKVAANISYLGFYPELTAGFSYGLRRSKTYYEEKLTDLKWMETDWSLSAALPLNLTRDRWLRGLRPAVAFRQINREMEPEIPLDFTQKSLNTLTYSAYFYNQARLSQRDIYPAWGQVIQAVFRHTPFTPNVSSQFYTGLSLFFPGLIRHHGIKWYGAFQMQTKDDSQFASIAAYPRGYQNLTFDQVFSFRTDYVMPLWYPEWNWQTVLYVKRIRAALFVDYLSGSHHGYSTSLASAGLELHADWHLLNVPAPLDIGLRLIYRDATGDLVPEFLFGINFSALY